MSQVHCPSYGRYVACVGCEHGGAHDHADDCSEICDTAYREDSKRVICLEIEREEPSEGTVCAFCAKPKDIIHMIAGRKAYICDYCVMICHDIITTRGGQVRGQKNGESEGKLQWHLLPWDAAASVVEVLMHGKAKYGARNWEKGIPYHELYDAILRHLTAWFQGEDFDRESGLHHVAHAACGTMFLLALVNRDRIDCDDRPETHTHSNLHGSDHGPDAHRGHVDGLRLPDAAEPED